MVEITQNTLTQNYEKIRFSKTLLSQRNLKTPAFRFSVEGKHLQNGAFCKRRLHNNRVIFLIEISSGRTQI